ncbi:MAG TPA: hypothetical protein VGN37_18625 [Actinocatenispora sp.]
MSAVAWARRLPGRNAGPVDAVAEQGYSGHPKMHISDQSKLHIIGIKRFFHGGDFYGKWR